MRTLSAELLAAQKAQSVVPYIKAVITDGVTTHTFDNLGIGGAGKRILRVEGTEEPFGGNTIIQLKNSDQFFAAMNLKGWKVTLGYGAKVNGTYEVSNVAPLFVLNQRDTSLEGELVTELQCLDYWWKIAYTEVYWAGKRLTGTVTDGLVLGEQITGSISGAKGTLSKVGSISIMVVAVTGTFQVGENASGSIGSCNNITSIDTFTGGAGPTYGRNASILNILKAIVPASILDVILDSDDPDATINTYMPLLLMEPGASARTMVRQLLQMSKCVGRLENDSKLHVLYPDPTANPDYTYHTDHVFWYQLRERAVILPNKVLFVNHMPGSVPEGEEQYAGVAQDDDSVDLLGELSTVQVNTTIESDAEATKRAEAWINQRVTEAYQGGVRAPMNCGQELYDQVRIIDSRSGVTVTGRVGRIVRSYLAPITNVNHSYEIGLTLGGIVSELGAMGVGPGALSMDLQDLTTNTLGELTNLDNMGEGANYNRVRRTQVEAGNLKLTSATVKDGDWYDESGVDIDADTGITIYGSDTAFRTRATKAGIDQCYVGADGAIKAGAGAVVLDSDGIELSDMAKVKGIGFSKYFYEGIEFYTHFESKEGFTEDLFQSGYVTFRGAEIEIGTGTTSGSYAGLEKDALYRPVTGTWDKPRRFKVKFCKLSNTNQILWLAIGEISNRKSYLNPLNHLGFYVSGDSIYASTGDVAGQTVSLLVSGTGTTSSHLIEVIFTPSVNAKFYVDGVLKATLTTHLPHGTTYAQKLLNISAYNSEATDKWICLSTWHFIQEP